MATKKKATKKKATTTKKAPQKASTLRNTAEERAKALPSESAEQNPGEPVAQLSSYARRVVELATPVLSSLKKLPGFDPVCLTDLLPAVDLLTTAETKWGTARSRSRAGVSPERVTAAVALRTDLTTTGRYVLRKDPVAQQEIDQVLEGTGVADLALDLERLASLVERHAEAFAAGDVDAGVPAAARAMANELGTGITPGDAADAQAWRNRLFHLVQDDLREVLAALKFHWRKQPPKLAILGVGYAAQLKRGRTRRGGGGSAPPAT